MAIGNAKPKTGRKDNLRLEEVVKLLEFAPDEITNFRLIGDQILSIKRHWIKIYAGKEKKVIKIPRYCLKHNPLNEDEPHDVHCPYCDLSHGGSESNATAGYEFFYLMNAIDRDEQENEPAKKSEPTKSEKKSGFKDPNSKTWTPVKVVRIPSSVAKRMQELKDLNKKKGKDGKTKTYDVDHPKFGCDVMLRYKPKASGTDKYSCDKGERTPITDEEKEYLQFNLSPELLTLTGLMTEKEAQEDFKRNEYVGGDETEEDEDEDGYALGKGKKKKKGDKKKSKKSRDEDEDEDDEDDEDEAPSKKKKSSKKSSKKSKSKDEDDDDEDEDEAPKKKKKSSKDKEEKSSKKSKDSGKKKKKKKDVPF